MAQVWFWLKQLELGWLGLIGLTTQLNHCIGFNNRLGAKLFWLEGAKATRFLIPKCILHWLVVESKSSCNFVHSDNVCKGYHIYSKHAMMDFVTTSICGHYPT